MDCSNGLVHGHNLGWRRVLEKTVDECKSCRFWWARKGYFFPSVEFSRINFVTFHCKVVGEALDNIKVVIDFEKDGCQPEFPVLALANDWWRLLKRASMNE